MLNNIRYLPMVESLECLSNTLTIGPLLGGFATKGTLLSDLKWAASET